MSKYEETFVTMKSCILFIILGFIQSVICFSRQPNVTQEADLVCPISYFRRKRAIEYTRWRATEETTPQFLVKVLDEEISPQPSNKKIVAVNILPITKGTEKIIIGGAAVPLPTSTATSIDPIREYTRFVPPTTEPDARKELQFIALPHAPVKRPARHPQRDESPPARPQFLSRTPSFHQYAPIAAVAFSNRATASPMTPSPKDDDHAVRTNHRIPTRTSPLPDISLPTRTEHSSDNYIPYQIIDDSERPNLIFMTRTSFETTYSPLRSTIDRSLNVDDSLIPMPRDFHQEEMRRHDSEKKDKESDASYNMMFYDEDMDVSTHKGEIYDDRSKHEKSTTSVIYDDLKEPIENELKEAAAISGMKEETEINDGSETTACSSDDNDDEGDKHITMSNKNKKVTVISLKESTPIEPLNEKPLVKRRQRCNLVNIRKLTFNAPHTLPDIVVQLQRWAEDSPVAKLIDITNGNYTTLENPIYMMIVEDPTSGQVVSAKQTVMIVAGIHGRDHHAVAAAMYILYQLIERTAAHSDLLSNYRFWIVPVFNPDGYDYSSTFPHRRNWSKNLRQNWEACTERVSCKTCETLGLRCTVQPCYGVNLDRNFEYQWIPTEELRSEHPCGPLYAGTRQLSEPETRALTYFLHSQKMPLFTFISLKEGDVLGILYPYSHTRKRRAMDKIYRRRASQAATAAYSIVGRHYVSGQTSEYLPLYAGGIEDWIDGHLGVDNTYTIMMFRPSEHYNSKLLTERVVHETFAAMDTLLLQSLEPQVTLAGNPMVNMKLRNAASHVTPTTILTIAYSSLRYLS